MVKKQEHRCQTEFSRWFAALLAAVQHSVQLQHIVAKRREF
jgi:hypothetical protein